MNFKKTLLFVHFGFILIHPVGFLRAHEDIYAVDTPDALALDWAGDEVDLLAAVASRSTPQTLSDKKLEAGMIAKLSQTQQKLVALEAKLDAIAADPYRTKATQLKHEKLEILKKSRKEEKKVVGKDSNRRGEIWDVYGPDPEAIEFNKRLDRRIQDLEKHLKDEEERERKHLWDLNLWDEAIEQMTRLPYGDVSQPDTYPGISTH